MLEVLTREWSRWTNVAFTLPCGRHGVVLLDKDDNHAYNPFREEDPTLPHFVPQWRLRLVPASTFDVKALEEHVLIHNQSATWWIRRVDGSIIKEREVSEEEANRMDHVDDWERFMGDLKGTPVFDISFINATGCSMAAYLPLATFEKIRDDILEKNPSLAMTQAFTSSGLKELPQGFIERP
jgi:hypothetical protein